MTKKKHHDNLDEGALGDPDAIGAAEPEVDPTPIGLRSNPADTPHPTPELAAETARADENYDRYLRAVADLDNYRKRTRNEMEEFRKYAVEGMVIQLLQVADNLTRAVDSAQTSGDLPSVVQGVSMTLRQLQDVLECHGVKRIEAEGLPFDPNLHEAVMRVETGPESDGIVVEELQRGYMLHGRVVRPAMVKVGQYTED